jgi:calcineurin-like phosphoesterase family protein
MNNIFFTSDTHFYHKNIIRYCNRPFSSIEEMNGVLIDNWNSVVKNNDVVYHLGDFAFCGRGILGSTIKKLNGNICLCKGNHDKYSNTIYFESGIKEILQSLNTIKINGSNFVLCHYALRVWNKSNRGSFHCFGHSHGKLGEYKNSYDVGVDNNNFTPISYEDLIKKFKR